MAVFMKESTILGMKLTFLTQKRIKTLLFTAQLKCTAKPDLDVSLIEINLN